MLSRFPVFQRWEILDWCETILLNVPYSLGLAVYREYLIHVCLLIASLTRPTKLQHSSNCSDYEQSSYLPVSNTHGKCMAARSCRGLFITIVESEVASKAKNKMDTVAAVFEAYYGTWLLSAICVVLTLVLSFVRFQPKNHPPGPMFRMPFMGNAYIFRGNPIKNISALRKRSVSGKLLISHDKITLLNCCKYTGSASRITHRTWNYSVRGHLHKKWPQTKRFHFQCDILRMHPVVVQRLAMSWNIGLR